MSNSDHPIPPSTKRRRGRQPRPSSLSSSVKAAVLQFANQVGQPRVIEPAGFRDFRGWLAYVGSHSAATAWAPLVDAVLRDTNGHRSSIEALKEDLVREIVKKVVIPRHGESSKLVSTNCGRQCARPANGVTLMTILDSIFLDTGQWRSFIDSMASPQNTRSSSAAAAAVSTPSSSLHHHSPVHAPSSSSSHHAMLSSSSAFSAAPTSSHHSTPSSHHSSYHAYSHSHSHSSSSSRHSRSSQQPPLPSFQELEDSLRATSKRGKRARR
ncbi:hypothetical protein BWQ96_09404 [Gracilariopsis chorda]|uniref:Uncharacterized protein n=1 Tax=Gracilariopsis chorda TaxID=448386 RepID=A0A2V3IFQ4_9FLOR|nr:hypothetical protein BWQ96_09404 [Gracilariopsis chorda]|eukprot:PXF40882.1 hypothetical protein BWQ96_09404 [Gracilariopsis chorda]